MAYTTNQLISGAYYASGVVSREFGTVSGTQFADGLQWLNNILAEKRVDEGMVPYESSYSFISRVGVKTYYIPNLIKIDTLVFYLDQVRYAMVYTQRNQFFGAPRVENIESLPFQWYWERKTGGGNLHIYFSPDRNYPMEVHGIFDIPPVVLGQDLSLNTTVADLGVPTFYFDKFTTEFVASLAPGQLVVNNFDLMGDYPSIGALVNYINSGIIPGVQAKIQVNDLVLYSTFEPPVPIYVQTTGYPPNGTRFIQNVTAATTANLDNSFYQNANSGIGAVIDSSVVGALVIDTVDLNTGDIVLIKDQTNSYENGVYIVSDPGSPESNWRLTRTTNYDQPIEIQNGDLFFVANIGEAQNAGFTFVQTSNVLDIGISPITFSPFSSVTFSNFSTIGLPLYEVFNAVGFDEFYITYLRYALASRICAEYAYDTPVGVREQLSKYESWINQKSRILDLEMKKVSTLQKRGSYNWAFVNLAKGWTPG